MNILIYGTGAVGTFLSTLIYEKNNNCILFSRGDKFELFRNSGITLKTNLKEHKTIYPDLFDTNKIITLSDLPFIGNLFKKVKKGEDLDRLLIFIAPRIL